MTPLAQGATIGRYVLESRLPSRGRADVWLARHQRARPSDPRFVVRAIRPELARKPAFVRPFTNEARPAASRRHRSIVPIYELLDMPSGHVITMEHVPGREGVRWRDYPGPLEALVLSLELEPHRRVDRSCFCKLRQRIGSS